MGVIAALFGRKASAQRSVRSVGEDGFVDLDLPLTELTKDPSGEFRLTAQGNFGGRPVGFSVVVGAAWKPQDNGGFTAYWGTVTLRAIGDASEAFVEELAKLYGMSLSAKRMLPAVVTQAVGLASDPRALMKDPVRMKLFFHSDVEDRYAEVFLNVDRSAKLVQFHEKDQEYRGNVLRALTEAA